MKNWLASITIIPEHRREQIYINQPLTKNSLLWNVQKFPDKDELPRFLSLPIGSVLTSILRTDFDNKDNLDTFLKCWLNPSIYAVDVHSPDNPIVLSDNAALTLNTAKSYIKAIMDKYLTISINDPSVIQGFYPAVTINNVRIDEMTPRLGNIKIMLSREFRGEYKKSREYLDNMANMLNNSILNPQEYNKWDYSNQRHEYTAYMRSNSYYTYKITTNDIISVALWELAECLRNGIYMTPCAREECKAPMVKYKNHKVCIFCESPIPESRKKRSTKEASKLHEARIKQNAYAFISRNFGIGKEACIEHIKAYIEKKKYRYPDSKLEKLVNEIYKNQVKKIKESE